MPSISQEFNDERDERSSQVARELVQRGASLLTDYFQSHDWIDRIDVDSFNIASTTHCILGQVFSEPRENNSGFVAGTSRLGIENNGDLYGFDIGNREVTIDDLQSEWITYLTTTREAVIDSQDKFGARTI